MSGLDAQFRQAVAEYKAGNKDAARGLLMDIVDQDEQHEQAWLYLSAVVGSLEEQQICLENVLAVNPDNARAKKGLAKVQQQLAARDESGDSHSASVSSAFEQGPSPFSTFDWNAPPPASSRTPGSHSAPIGAEYESASGDQVMGGNELGGFPSFDSFDAPQSTPTLDHDSSDAWAGSAANDIGLDAHDQTDDPFASTSSVDWDRSGSPAAYGSGQQVDLPSEQEYDSWVQNLNLGGDTPERGSAALSGASAPGAPDPFAADNTRSFGDSGYMIDSDVYAEAAAYVESPSYNVGTEMDEFDAFGATPYSEFVSALDSDDADSLDDLRDSAASFDSPALHDDGSGIGAAGTDDDDLSDLDFSFDDDADASAGNAKPAPRRKKDEHARYYTMIPDDIEVEAAPARLGLLFVAILVMIGLNVASFALLLM